MYENNGYACNYVQDIISGEEKVSPGGRSPPFSYGPGHQMIRYADITL